MVVGVVKIGYRLYAARGAYVVMKGKSVMW